ncbi:MAG: hypothetical protein RLZZ21_1433 [Planctomycetota bacterium]|jgi:hypothetical protein
MTPAVVGVHLRIDRRRPASWLALATAATAVVWLVMQPPSGAGLRVAAAVMAGTVAAVMAIGEVPRGLYGPVRDWVWLRAAWPLAAAVAATAACVAAFPVAGGQAVVSSALFCLAVGATAESVRASVRAGATPADAVSMPLAVAAAAAAAAIATARAGGGGDAACGGAVLLTWLACSAVLAAWRRQRGPTPWTGSAGTVGLFGCGPEGRLLAGVAMATALAGMVGWLFLAADAAGWYRLLAAVWFMVAAVPQATLAAAEVERRGRPAAVWAALLGWPLVVAAVLAPSPAAAVERVVSIGGLAAAAVVLTLLAAGLRRVGAGRETALAVALAAALGAGLMLRESGHSCETLGSWQVSPVVRGVVSCKEVHVPAGVVRAA